MVVPKPSENGLAVQAGSNGGGTGLSRRSGHGTSGRGTVGTVPWPDRADIGPCMALATPPPPSPKHAAAHIAANSWRVLISCPSVYAIGRTRTRGFTNGVNGPGRRAPHCVSTHSGKHEG